MPNPLTALRFSPARDVTALALFGAGLVTWQWLQFARSLRVYDELARGSAAFECRAENEGPRILFVGDSVAVGCGAARPEDSIAGLIAQEFPRVTIVNRARNGARTSEAIAQLEAEGDAKYDLILITVGTNDILKRTRFQSLPAKIDALLTKARQRSDCVICTTSPNIGLVPMFFAPLSWWLTLRSRQLRDLFAEAAKQHGVHYVNFFHPRSTDPFLREAQRYYAQDRFHPSTDCYRYLYATLRAATPLARVLTGGGD
jgi:lysophospholipase L1-like esterase